MKKIYFLLSFLMCLISLSFSTLDCSSQIKSKKKPCANMNNPIDTGKVNAYIRNYISLVKANANNVIIQIFLTKSESACLSNIAGRIKLISASTSETDPDDKIIIVEKIKGNNVPTFYELDDLFYNGKGVRPPGRSVHLCPPPDIGCGIPIF